MFSFPTLNDLRIFDENLLARQAEFNLRDYTFAYLNKIFWLLDVASITSPPLSAVNISYAAFDIFCILYFLQYIYLSSCSVLKSLFNV